jgi:phytoene dehydrogenase-like protein
VATADIVVAGAGHNSLIAAAYAAKAGFECLVLDARPLPGGGAANEELLLPGYLVDSCSTGHTLIRANPLITRDELGLVADHGLTYVEPDPVAHVAFPDGEHLTMWLDMERTCEEIAHFSRADADAYRRLVADYDGVKAVLGAGTFLPPGHGPSLDQRLAEAPHGGRWRRIKALSSWDVIRHEFESRHVRAFMLWMAYQTMQPPDLPGSGLLAYSLVCGRQAQSWSIPLGGSGQLADALVAYVAQHGGTVLCDQEVRSLILEDGRCVGVQTADGERHLARRAVLSTIHVKHLVDMAPPDAWGEDFVYGVKTYDVGTPGMAVYLAATVAPEFETRDGGTRTAVSAGVAGWPEDLLAYARDCRENRPIDEAQWLLVATPTLVDPSRAPQGHHTVKLLTMQPYAVEGQDWDSRQQDVATGQLAQLRRWAPGFTDDVILASLVRSPVDIERNNMHMIHGAFHGGDRGIAFSGALRPVPGYSAYRMPIEGLYQTGGTTHPGGSITGAPGRNAAMVMLADLGIPLEDVVARASVPANS